MKSIAFIDAGMLRPAIVNTKLQLSDCQKLDWQKLLKWMSEISGPLIDCHYFDSLPENMSTGLSNFHLFLEQELKIKLHFLPLRSKKRMCNNCSTVYANDEQKGVDVMMALQIYKLAPFYEHAILVSGDGDFSAVVDMIRQDYARQTTVVGWESAISPQLRALACSTISMERNSEKFIVRSDV